MTRHSQLRWFALLVVAVLLPTISLLWFMSRVVANERLVIRQKLAALYQDQIDDAGRRASALLQARLKELGEIHPQGNPYAILSRWIAEGMAQGMVLWDANGRLIYPRLDDGGAELPGEHPLATAAELELGKQAFAEAAAIYRQFENHARHRVAIAARLGHGRCLAKLGQSPGAVEACLHAAFPEFQDDLDADAQVSVEHARLFLLTLLHRGNSPGHDALKLRALTALRKDVYDPTPRAAKLSAMQNIFVARRLLETLQRSGEYTNLVRDLPKWIAAEERSIAVAEELRTRPPSSNRWHTFDGNGETLRALHGQTADGVVLLLMTGDGLATFFEPYRDSVGGAEAAFRVFDGAGRTLAGAAPEGSEPFLVAPLPESFPGWRIALHLSGTDIFERAAKRQIAVYIWTGVLVIVLILLAAGLATQAIGRQMRLNRMKNNFIATVSHELKTPLASMRVLVDTLLEGNIRDEAQGREYLRMTARENERLSRMIDQFLTFSRMERNKVAFNLAETTPAEAVRDALESLRTKFPGETCPVRVDVAAGLPPVHADHDAIVTVLVNLLENACKYTGPVKRIELRAFADGGEVCFAVADNGIGLSRRHIRRIFERFYQVDNSLARQAEGCGLGLSIVKFIVDAHKGRVTVESKPGEGSTFTVRLRATEPAA